ncbi:MAG: ATP-binding protein [Rectinemataceae bacterium]
MIVQSTIREGTMGSDNERNGLMLTADALKKTLDYVFQRNNAIEEADPKGKAKGTPVCIWGTHGIGKTQIVQDYALSHGWKFAYAPVAQFEEFGDLHGLPAIEDPDPHVDGDERTVFRAPDWVPREPGPGILLLDDLNRADDRILRGLMQLLQTFKLVSWDLPSRWQIVATANPEGGDYSVTPMDDAMMTRMLHFSLCFEPKVWSAWAAETGIDPRCIAFVLTYPETVTGKRTTPRTLVQFFELIKPIKDLAAEAELVNTLARSCLDEMTAASFVSFISGELEKLVDPAELLYAPTFEKAEKRIKEMAAGKQGSKRLDRLAVFMSRILVEIRRPEFDAENVNRENLIQFLLMADLPNDLRYSFWLEISATKRAEVLALLRDKRLAMITLSGM